MVEQQVGMTEVEAWAWQTWEKTNGSEDNSGAEAKLMTLQSEVEPER